MAMMVEVAMAVVAKFLCSLLSSKFAYHILCPAAVEASVYKDSCFHIFLLENKNVSGFGSAPYRGAAYYQRQY
jgi:hypothetical protein